MRINERIKEMRTLRNLTLLEVAEQLGVKEATMQRYESGSIKNIKYETITKLSEIFDCSPVYLMGWSNDKENGLDFKLSNHERRVITAYHQQPAARPFVDKLLGITEEHSHLMPVAAHNDDASEDQLRLMQEDIDEL